MMPQFTKSGEGAYDFWLIDGSPNFAVIPAGVIPQLTENTPIRLQNGNTWFGARHILKRHRPWLVKHQPNGCVATLAHRKLSQIGRVYSTEEDNKLSFAMRVHPEALMILRHEKDFLTIVSMYLKQSQIEGTEILRYMGTQWAVSPVKQANF